ncbi:MAG: ABC transporter substrate-binding protein [Burkholderiales bacterium]|nr:ABC transporter substrate-binding protein [Burkholderiales bacterium]
MTSITRRIAVIAAPFALAFGLGAAHAQTTKIAVGYVPIPDLMPLYVAKEQGFFDKRGLDVTLQTIPINPNIPPALQSDSIQIGTVTPSVLMQAADSGLALKVIAGGSVLTKDSKSPVIIVRKGVDIKAPQDFVGKRVGVAGFGATLHVLFRKWLADNGVDAKKVNFVEVALPQTLDLMRGGTIDAAVPAEPFGARMLHAGVGTAYAYVSDDFPATGVLPIVYGSTSAWLQKNPQAAKAFREAIDEAIAFHAKNPDVSRANMGKYLRLPPEVLATLPVPRLATTVSEDHLRFWIDAMQAQAMLRTRLDAADFVVR